MSERDKMHVHKILSDLEVLKPSVTQHLTYSEIKRNFRIPFNSYLPNTYIAATDLLQSTVNEKLFNN